MRKLSSDDQKCRLMFERREKGENLRRGKENEWRIILRARF